MKPARVGLAALLGPRLAFPAPFVVHACVGVGAMLDMPMLELVLCLVDAELALRFSMLIHS
eukprot:1718391-Pyramimonas_sp.AAC.1